MVNVAFIDPLSDEGKEIIRQKGSLDNVFQKNNDLINIITHTPQQTIDDDTTIPKNYAELAIKRLEWYIRKKNNDKELNHKDYSYLFNEKITEMDTIAFYMTCQAIGTKHNPKSREARAMVEAQGKIIEERLTRITQKTIKDELIEDTLNNITYTDDISWFSLEKMIATKKLSLIDLVIDNSKIILDKDDFIERFADKFKERSPEAMYDILIGDKIKELITNRVIMQNTEKYINKVHEMSSKIETHPSLEQLSENIQEMLNKESERVAKRYGGSGDINIGAATLEREAFPPCITNTINGVGSGNRNDAIVLFLTSFISYARLHPNVFRNDISIKVSDRDPDLSITLNEILPIIYEAADNCSPPLFEDQPQEKINITSKLGFGMHNTPDLKHEDETKWYTPMSCDKIKMHLSPLCKPDGVCKGVGNPLSYYSRRKWQLSKENNSKNETKEET